MDSEKMDLTPNPSEAFALKSWTNYLKKISENLRGLSKPLEDDNLLTASDI